ncbi:MAG TPA: carboxypeptidase-like regulatory domain-containing protein [Gemmatimonadales bacterium]|nr:carboxypeptidase-like regulatory domain-containing protein [Gemmatimonadales bacterium]
MVAGQVVDAATAAPVGEGFVVLLDERGREVGRTLTGADGRYLLNAPAPGRYRLRSERIGYVAFVIPPFTLDAGQTLTQQLTVSALALQLAVVEVTGRTSCRFEAGGAEATAAVWEEVRKALAAAVWTERQRTYKYRTIAFLREWDEARRDMLAEVTDTLLGHTPAPFASVPAAELAAHGYIVAEADSIAYYGPDGVVLQDSTFLESHCFGLARRSVRGVGQIGLSFRPAPGRRLPDVRGVLWLDEASAELRALEFSYTDVPEGVRDGRIGGTVEFLRLPSGAWIILRWELRMPRLVAQTVGLGYGTSERRVRVRGFRDRGGAVLEIHGLDGRRLYPP